MRITHGLSALLAPDRCTACGARGRQPWCVACEHEAAGQRIDRACRRCGAAAGGHGCWGADAPVARGLTAYRYRGVVAAAIVAGKARGATAVWPHLGARLGAAVAGAGLDAPDLVTWVPTDPRRVRQRGVDHAQVLGRHVAARLGVPAMAVLAVAARRPDQAQLPEAARRAVPDTAFRISRRVDRAAVLLIDDVLTTGGTANAAANVLRVAGADRVELATLARAGDHPLGRRWSGQPGPDSQPSRGSVPGRG